MKFVIIGGTGTLGRELIRQLSGKEHEIVCFSRDELKQQEMKKTYPDVRYIIGDIRDRMALKPVMSIADVVFHVAALKHVDVLEANPTEAIKTNLLGTMNVAETATEYGVPHVVFSSTDKAVLPINTYGMTKAISERYLFSLNEQQQSTKFSVFRWANVMGSRGSVVHYFAETLRASGFVNITDIRMTRFWIHIEDAVKFLLENYENASTSQPMIPAMKSSGVVELAEAVADVVGCNEFDMNVIGIRAGEKLHECILSSHDRCIRSDTSERLTKTELADMVRRVVG